MADKIFELRLEGFDQVLIEIDLAKRTTLLAPAPDQYAPAVEVVPRIAWQCYDLLAWLKVFDAESALVV